MSPPAAPAMTPPVPRLLDEILEEIFLNLPTPAALARTSTACPRFRRIITEGSFLRRYRKLHPPPLLGFVADKGGFHPAQQPHPSAPLARALADAADFSYSFVPKPTDGLLSPWYARDIRDGHVLLECSSRFEVKAVFRNHAVSGSLSRRNVALFTNLAVCDPLSRRYVLLPPIPEEMTIQQEPLIEFEPMLAPIGQDEDETSFQVICTAHYKSKLVAFVFSSVTGQWCMAASPTWSSLGTVGPSWKCLSHFNYSSGCFYWTALWSGNSKLLVLDTRLMEFYTVDALAGCDLQLISQPRQSICMSTIVDGTKGALEMLTLVGDYSRKLFHLCRTTQQNNGDSSSEGQPKTVIVLPHPCFYFTVGATEGFLFLRVVQEAKFDDNLHVVLAGNNDADFCSLDVKTFELKKVCSATFHEFPNRVHSYFGFPPSLSKPSL